VCGGGAALALTVERRGRRRSSELSASTITEHRLREINQWMRPWRENRSSSSPKKAEMGTLLDWHLLKPCMKSICDATRAGGVKN
jgi:hypothetical protein